MPSKDGPHALYTGLRMTVTLRSRMSVTVSRQESPRNVVPTMYKRSAEVENLQFFASCIARNYQRILFYRAEISQAEIPYSTAGGAAVGNLRILHLWFPSRTLPIHVETHCGTCAYDCHNYINLCDRLSSLCYI